VVLPDLAIGCGDRYGVGAVQAADNKSHAHVRDLQADGGARETAPVGVSTGGPGSSSQPGSRSHWLHPSFGMARTLADPGATQPAALPSKSMPSKWTQCQQGRWSVRQGLK
jgi:hypothetical protein